MQQLAEARAKLLVAASAQTPDGMRLIAQLLREENPDLLLLLATEVAKNEKTIALLIHEPTGQLAFAQHSSASKDLAAVLKQVLATIPGKGGGTRDFVRAKLVDPSMSNAALVLATRFVVE